MLTVAVVYAYLRSPSLQPRQRRLDAGKAPTRALLVTVAGGDQLETVLMRSGFVSNYAVKARQAPSDELFAAARSIPPWLAPPPPTECGAARTVVG